MADPGTAQPPAERSIGGYADIALPQGPGAPIAAKVE
jgi:hypothetical protein